MRIDVGLDVSRPHHGACTYPYADIVTQHRAWEYRVGQHHRQSSSVVLGVTSAAAEQAAIGALDVLLEQVAPVFEHGRLALHAFTAAMDASMQRSPVDGALAWTDGRHLRIAFQGQMRVVLLQQEHAKRVPPPDQLQPRWFASELDPGDWLVIAVPATDAVLPLGSILRFAQQGMDASTVCRTATAQAAQADPFNHHAVVAAHVLPA